MSLIRNTNKPISSRGGVVIHGHSLSFQLGQPETIAGKHEIREMKADGAVVDVWIARSELNKSRVSLYLVIFVKVSLICF